MTPSDKTRAIGISATLLMRYYGAGNAVITSKQDVISPHAMNSWSWRRLAPPGRCLPDIAGESEGLGSGRAARAGLTGGTIIVDAFLHIMG